MTQLLTVYAPPEGTAGTLAWAATRAWVAPQPGDQRPPSGGAVSGMPLDDLWLEDHPPGSGAQWVRPTLLGSDAAPDGGGEGRRVLPTDVALLVVDQQGADAAAVHGARRTIALGRVPHLWLTLTPPSRVGPCDRVGMLRWLQDLGYAWRATFHVVSAEGHDTAEAGWGGRAQPAATAPAPPRFADLAAVAAHLEAHPADTVSGWLSLQQGDEVL